MMPFPIVALFISRTGAKRHPAKPAVHWPLDGHDHGLRDAGQHAGVQRQDTGGVRHGAGGVHGSREESHPAVGALFARYRGKSVEALKIASIRKLIFSPLSPISHTHAARQMALNQFPTLHAPNWVDGVATDILKRWSLRLLVSFAPASAKIQRLTPTCT